MKKNIYSLNAHGSNTGTFFKLPNNVRVLIPSKLDYTYTLFYVDSLFFYLSLLKPNDDLSNLNKIFSYINKIGDIQYKIYCGDMDMLCPNIEYSDDIDKDFRAGVSKLPCQLLVNYIDDYYSETNKKYYQSGEQVYLDNNGIKKIQDDLIDGIEKTLNSKNIINIDRAGDDFKKKAR